MAFQGPLEVLRFHRRTKADLCATTQNFLVDEAIQRSAAALFDDRVVAVGEEALAHGFGVLFRGEGTDLDVEELVLWLVADGYGVASFFEGGEEGVGVFLMGDGGYLDQDGSGS
jgi:hypothetical protein